MITLARDCLLFCLANGESVPFSAEMISVELVGQTAAWFEPEFASHAAKAVFHYFKHELERQTVTAAEFSGAMEKVLRGFKPGAGGDSKAKQAGNVAESDLWRLAREAGGGCELFFFPKLREELRQHLAQGPRAVRFHGLRGCVKELAGTRRWGARCRDLEDQIIGFLRQCLGVEAKPAEFYLVVE